MDGIVEAIKQAVVAAVRELQPVNGDPKHRLLTIEQAAEYLGCAPNTVRNLVAAGLIETFHWPLKERQRPKPYFDRVELDRKIDQIKERNTA